MAGVRATTSNTNIVVNADGERMTINVTVTVRPAPDSQPNTETNPTSQQPSSTAINDINENAIAISTETPTTSMDITYASSDSSNVSDSGENGNGPPIQLIRNDSNGPEGQVSPASPGGSILLFDGVLRWTSPNDTQVETPIRIMQPPRSRNWANSQNTNSADNSNPESTLERESTVSLRCANGAISVFEFARVIRNLEFTTEKPSLLLLDCRDWTSFCKSHVLYPLCVHVTSAIDEATENFPSKAAAANFIRVNLADLLAKLREPGFYSDIVILDDTSTVANCSAVVKTVRAAVIKWEEGTNTRVRILEGGMKEIFKESTIKLLSIKDQKVDRLTSSKRQKQNLKDLMAEDDCSAESKEILQNFHHIIVYLDKSIDNTKELIELRNSIKSLDGIKTTLLQDRHSKIVKELEAQAPAEVKCPVCFEIYSGCIVQCGNGHGLCLACFENVQNGFCPECRLRYIENGVLVANVRNRALEKLITSYLSSKCRCGGTIPLIAIQEHAKLCSSGAREKEEISGLENEIKSTAKQIKRVEQTLERTKMKINDIEKRWARIKGYKARNVIPEECKSVLDFIHEKKMDLNVLSTTLLSSVFFIPEYSYFE